MEKLNKIFRTDQLAAIDKYTIEHEPISSLELMERAAGAWTRCFLNFFENVPAIAVVVGKGNNGGDGYAIARLLKQKGKEVAVFRLPEEEMSGDCRANFIRWQEEGGAVTDLRAAEDLQADGETVIVDALFGSGLNRKVTGLAASVIRRMNSLPNTVVAVDMPSGLMGEDNAGNDPEAIVRADYTFTFQFPRLAFMLPENAAYAGRWSVVDIGLSEDAIGQTPSDWYYTTEEVIRDLLPPPSKFAHKGTNGRGLLVAGRYGMMGAAVLAALLADRRLLRRVDYSLLLTFLFFFVFVGNMKVLPTVSEALSGLVAGREMTVGILLSQVISNVPAAMLLSGFTADYPALLLGVNLGGLGTLIASMASLISYKLYAAADGARTGKYMLFFTAVNVVLLAVLWGAMVIIYK